VRRLVGAALAAIVFLSGCGADAMGQEMASVGFPSTWEVAKTTTNSGCVPLGDPHCPSATEYLITPPDLLAVYQAAREAVAAEGYEIEDVRPRCDAPDPGPGLPRCWLFAHKNGFRLDLNVYAPGTDVDAVGVSKADNGTVRVIVSRG